MEGKTESKTWGRGNEAKRNSKHRKNNIIFDEEGEAKKSLSM